MSVPDLAPDDDDVAHPHSHCTLQMKFGHMLKSLDYPWSRLP